MKPAKVNAYIMYIFGKIMLSSIHATKFISKCISLMTSKRQRLTYILDTDNMEDLFGTLANYTEGIYTFILKVDQWKLNTGF